MSNFSLNEKVVALNSAQKPNQPREAGKIYTVTSIFYCDVTGKQMININNTKKCSKTLHIKCSCGKLHNTSDHYAYTFSTNFIRPDDIDAAIMKAVAIEDFEQAILLTNILESIAQEI
jgi:hypothetical protein